MVLDVNDILIMTIFKPFDVNHPGQASFKVLDIVSYIGFDLSAALIIELVIDFLFDTDYCTF
jgi:hypothetical protein|tara:strand:+ start:605 stop:790 length:186 start_codon:yes stop_codon:yes gene_type:complete